MRVWSARVRARFHCTARPSLPLEPRCISTFVLIESNYLPCAFFIRPCSGLFTFGNHNHPLCACCGGTSCVAAASRRPHASAGRLRGRNGRILGQNCSCRARLPLKLRIRAARAALVRFNSVCSAVMAGQARGAARWPLGLEHCVFQPCLSFQNGNLHITQNSTNSIEGVLFPLIVN